MTDLRAAAQQALDFCEFLWREVAMNDYAEEKREAVEVALRAALAQEQAEPVQEPVAWAPQWAIDRLTGQMGAVAEPVTWGVHTPLYAGETCDSVPIYTAPPKRKAEPVQEPLTDEEIALISAECAASHQHTDWHFARAIERAHAIGV